MSKGISKQQQQLLGLAVAVSRLRNGEPVARVPKPHPRWYVPVVTGVPADIDSRIAAHVVGGVGLRPRLAFEGRTNPHLVELENTDAAASARSSVSRALTTLCRRGLLAHRNVDRRSSWGEWSDADGFCLTAAGLEVGLRHEPVIPDLDRRLWLVCVSGKKRTEHPEWHNHEFLPSPGKEDRPQSTPRPDRRLGSWHVRKHGGGRSVLIPVREVPPELGLLAAKVRALITQNDPDAVRAGLAEIAQAIERLAG